MVVKILIIVLTTLLIITGLVGCVVPILPGPLFVLMGAFLYAWYTGFAEVTWGVLGVLALLTLVSQALDYLASTMGARKFGASRWGVAGSFAGALVGLFFGIPGILIGPFVGAMLFEMLRGRNINESFKIGYGTLVGFLGGAIGKVAIAITMIGIFLMVQVF